MSIYYVDNRLVMIIQFRYLNISWKLLIGSPILIISDRLFNVSIYY